jgi:hypothetical protein
MLTSKLPFAAISASRFLAFVIRALQPSSSRMADTMKLPRHTGGYGILNCVIARQIKSVGRD